MAVTGREKFGIFLVAGFQTIVVDGLVLLQTTVHDAAVVVAKRLKAIKDGLSVACPIALVVLVHVADVAHLVVAYHHVTASFRHLA